MRLLTLTEVEATFKKWHVPYSKVPGCDKRSNSSGFSTTSITGVMFHHTAGDASDANELSVLVNGRTGLRGPLCNFGVGDDGIVDIVALGCANHAGGGDPETLAMVQKETTPLTSEIKPNESAASSRAVGGNSRFYGWEVYYGIRNDPTPNPLQYRATVLSMCAIIDKLDEVDKANTWTGKACIGHREWTTNKIDPSAVKMHIVRQEINALRKAGPAAAKNWYLTGKLQAPTPPPAKPGGPVATTNPNYVGTTEAKAVVKSMMESDVYPAPNAKDVPANPYWTGASWFRYVGEWTGNTNAAVSRLEREVAALKALIVEIKDSLKPPTV